MKIVNTSAELVAFLDSEREKKKSVGFVPTMGALHKGHGSLISRSSKENDITVVSVFVNPTQFNDPEDLKKYPRTLEADTKIAESDGCDILYVPEVNDVYPEGKPQLLNLDFGPIEYVMEGAFRKDHFNGMSTVVKRLFDIVKPDNAYFGEKDYQQLAIIKRMVEILRLKVNIVACETVREADGLAMSSRNARLTPEQRKTSLLISQALFRVKELKKKESVKMTRLRAMGILAGGKDLTVDYFEIADDKMLQPVSEWGKKTNNLRAFVAAKVGDIRLIDNIGL